MQIPLPTEDQALPGREVPVKITNSHFILNNPIIPNLDENIKCADFALGCFWGAERKFWENAKVYSTAVGYMGGLTPNASYEEVCSGLTGHTETVRVFFNPEELNYKDLLKIFWESHDPTQGMRQGNDVGTQYRSAIFTHTDSQNNLAKESLSLYTNELNSKGYPEITTEIREAPEFFYAEDYHQQYLAKNPNGYCGIGGTGILCPI